MAAETMNGGEAVARTLVRLGVTHVFGIVSVHNLPTYHALAASDIEVVACRHEQFAAHAADGYARATGRLGVVLASSGPGTTNTMSGLYEAQFGSSPVLLVTGQTESGFYGKGKGFLHENEKQLDMLRTVTRRAETVWRTEDIGRVIASVARDCRTGRPQPGAVEIPIDQQYREAEVEIPEWATPGPVRPVPDGASVAEAAAALSDAERPLIWAGGGVVSADASAELVALARPLGAPVITTIEGRGSIPEDDDLALGPRTERPALESIIGEADVVLAVGTRFQNYSTRMWRLPVPGRLVHLDADPSVIGRNYAADIGIVCDAKLGLEALAAEVTGGGVDPGYVDRARKAVQADLERSWEEIGPDHRQIAATVRRLLPRDAIIARDSTVPVYLWGNRTLPILEPRTSIRPSSVAIGPGIGLAVGAAAGTRRRTLLMAGDGGFQMGLGELATAAQYSLPLVVCVFNDRGYGVLRTVEDAVMGERFGVDNHTPDFAALAAAIGIPSEHVADTGGFETAFAAAVDRDGPTLLDIDLTALAPLTFPLPAHQRSR
ncbi:MAG TPA: thiamine pyrophosphate-binding protein [Acidimicrobiia bacterium]|nr:thiamine pyrophosphate-binding protein [Acidimicrobiia bacterium]